MIWYLWFTFAMYTLGAVTTFHDLATRSYIGEERKRAVDACACVFCVLLAVWGLLLGVL